MSVLLLRRWAEPPTLRQVVSTWTLCGLRLVPRRANDGYTAELLRALVSVTQPTTGVQVVRPAAPQCLDSLTLDARRTGPLLPRAQQVFSFPTPAFLRQGDFPPTPIMLRQFAFDPLPFWLFPHRPGDGLSCDNCSH